MGRDTIAGFGQFDLEGSRLRDVALLFLVAVPGLIVLFSWSAVVAVAGGAALIVSGVLVRRGRRVCSVACADGYELTFGLRDGSEFRARVLSARMGGRWISLVVRDGAGRRRALMLFADQFAGTGDFRRFRLWLRAALRDEASAADGGWSDWRPRWWPDSRD